MGKDVQIVPWCDEHAEQGERVIGGDVVTRTIGLDGEWRTLEMCPVCDKELLARLAELWEKRGVKVPQPAKKSTKKKKSPGPNVDASGNTRKGKPPVGERNRQCLLCPENYAADSGLASHLEAAHGLPPSIPQFLGKTCPLCADKFEALGGHTVRMHNCSHVTQAFVRAREQGDTHGVVRAVLERALAVSSTA